MKDWTQIEVTGRDGVKRTVNARVEKFDMGDGRVKWHVVTKSGRTLGDLHATEAEAFAAFEKLSGIRGFSTNDKLYHSIIRHQIYLERYKAGVFKRVRPTLAKAITDMINKIDRMPDNTTRARYERVLAEIQRLSLEASDELAKQLKSELKELAKVERGAVASMMTEAIPAAVAVKVGLPALNVLKRIQDVEPFQGFVLEEWTKRVGTSMAVKARQQLYIGLAEGESVPKLVRRMKFVGDQTTRDLEMVVRTSVNHVTNQVKKSIYAENADVLEGVMWRATLDSRTTPICQARDGQMYPVDDHPTPPAHPNCRSVLVPVVKSFKDLGFDGDELPEGTRASMNGQVPRSETYNTWLRKQPREFVEDVLGKEKAALYLDQKLSLDKFIDERGKTLTLDQIRQKYL